MPIKSSLLILPMPLLALTLAACGGNNNSSASGVTDAAVVATAAPDFSSGAVSLALTSAPFTAQNGLDATTSDLSIRADGNHFFVIRRYGTNTISRYAAATPTTADYTYSTNDSGESNSNPYDIVVLNETKAYLIRYGSSTIWIVNPSATSEATFKTGSIDLSAYTVSGTPDMSAGLIKNGKLYVAMQRLDSSFAASQNGYVAVIDTGTDQEITTGSSEAALKGIQLPVRDPVRLASLPGSDAVLVDADGGYDGDFNQQYDGGIVSINPDSGYATTLVVDDGDDTTHPYGVLTDFAIAATDRGYFVGSTGFSGAQTVYRFNPAGGATPVAVSALQGLQLGPVSTDASGNLWVGQVQPATSDPAPGLMVFGFANGSETVIESLIGTSLNPLNIDFVSVPNS